MVPHRSSARSTNIQPRESAGRRKLAGELPDRAFGGSTAKRAGSLFEREELRREMEAIGGREAVRTTRRRADYALFPPGETRRVRPRAQPWRRGAVPKPPRDFMKGVLS